ncbi:anti-sigma factor [Microvirga sp. 17 mud 1-3]|uniref:anti-sigma factor family protein n=1 Tax=Microvirga sp. 17 mud 1-3 TaxID=2082949 RepID=UPI000D6D8768|nr:anti-sigma factor [Microvirga sp. 17 mud 1-3]AWM86107.1 anti-sigma factor [Microvirga sp. 17 mud 1-3]
MTVERPIGEDDLQAYVDGYLQPDRRAAVDAYLASHDEAAAQVAAYMRQREALRQRLSGKAGEPIPSRLRVANLVSERRHSRWPSLATAAAVAGLLAGSVIGAVGHAWLTRESTPTAQERIGPVAQDAFAAYRTYVVETAHPVEVGASQEAHLVQWLSRRLGKPLQAPDLTGQGFRLIGGRLLPAESSPAALFMYEDTAGRRLTLYARPGSGDEPTTFRFEAQGNVSAFLWIDRDLSYAVTGRMEREKLLLIAEAIYSQTETQPTERKGSL